MSPRIITSLLRLREREITDGPRTYNSNRSTRAAVETDSKIGERGLSGNLLHVNKQLIAELITHALEDDPNECCGFLFGKDGVAAEVRRVANVHDDPLTRYFMDYREVEKVQRDADALGQDLMAIYHSHTYTHGYPSETDVETAVETGWVPHYYLVISLVEKTRPVVRAFWVDEKATVEEVFIKTG